MAQNVTRGGTRWRQSLVYLAVPALAMLAMVLLTVRGAVPLNLAITGQEFKMASRQGSEVVAAHGATAYADVIEMKDGSHRAALRSSIESAEISDGTCISLVLTFPIVGAFTIQLETTGQTRITELGAYADYLSARNANLGPSTKDGKPPALDMSNVVRPAVSNKDASEIAGLPGGHPGTMGLEIPGAVRATDLRIGGLGATIAGTLSISGIGLPSIHHGRGHGECF